MVDTVAVMVVAAARVMGIIEIVSVIAKSITNFH